MKISREKHLDHMVRVVPLIVLGYAIQCWIISGMNTPIGGTSLLFLGALLGMMIAGFITYDVKHEVHFSAESMEIKFLGSHTVVPYSQMTDVLITNSGRTFGSLVMVCGHKKYRIYFVDEADKVKAFVDGKRMPVSEAKAA